MKIRAVITGYAPSAVSILLLIYGLAVALGNIIGGKQQIAIRLNSYSGCFLSKRLFLSY